MARALSGIYALGVRPDRGSCGRAAAPRIGKPFKIRLDKRIRCVEESCFWDSRNPRLNSSPCFATAAPFAIVKGFAIGRTIFQDAALAWFARLHERCRRLQGDGREFLQAGERVAPRARGGRDMKTIRCTAAQAAVRYFANQHVDAGSGEVRYFGGVGHIRPWQCRRSRRGASRRARATTNLSRP